MSKDKYTSIFSPQMEAIVFIILQMLFRNARSIEIGNIPGSDSPVLAGFYSATCRV